MNYCFDYLSAMLAHNFMNPDQFAEFYWPYMKQVLDVLCEKKMHALIFSEGTILRYKDCFKDYPKGFLTILPETDDVFGPRHQAGVSGSGKAGHRRAGLRRRLYVLSG